MPTNYARNILYMLIIGNMATVRNLEALSGKWNIVKACTSGNFCTEMDREIILLLVLGNCSM
jgi:hypothetical protein